jgi:hypothetical protein
LRQTSSCEHQGARLVANRAPLPAPDSSRAISRSRDYPS